MKTFKQILFSVIFVVLLSNAGWGQLLTEDFNYTPGSLLNTNGWTSHSGAFQNDLTVTSPQNSGLTFTNYSGAVSTTNAVSLTTFGDDENRTFATQTTGSVYTSFLIKVSAAQTGAYFFSLGVNPFVASTFRGRVWIKSGVSGFNLGLSNASNTAIYGLAEYNFGTVYLIILKYEIVAASDDKVSLFVYQSGDNFLFEPGIPTIGPIIESGVDINPGAIALRQATSTTSATLIVDGIKVGTSWADVPMPVTLSSLSSSVINRNVRINWTTAEEINNAGFEVERAEVRSQNLEFSKVGFVSGQGTKNTSTNYSFEDKNLNTGKYKYRLKQVDNNGNYEYFELNGEVEIGVPRKYDVSQNYPNPFNPVTKINFDLPENGLVNIRLYDILGREVAVIVNEVRNAGYHTVQFDGSKLGSGVYFYQMSAGKFSGVKKMSVIK